MSTLAETQWIVHLFLTRMLSRGRTELEELPKVTKALTRSQQRRHDDIVHAALKIFDRDGFEAAKMADIADEAGVAKGTLYLYFDTKADLMEGVIVSTILPALQKIGDAADADVGSARERLARQMRIAARRMASPEMAILLRHMISGGRQHQPVVRFYYEKVVQLGIEHIKATLDHGVKTGEFRETVKDIDPLVFVGAPIYTSVWNILFDDMQTLDADKLIDDYLDTVTFGLLAER
ncbi:TetR/AcrR family transcriptional regulator [uncultured Roseobacter sp.]|uniref:TetR/AcrR family transcriptional regulator n=1 Tax=uncultured Roseobacter sp. TaxID=114847 RepID=UPI002639FBC2|nr:TetR/AcrR family transcriptional regulator [uncultured Roseobacter sp.]